MWWGSVNLCYTTHNILRNFWIIDEWIALATQCPNPKPNTGSLFVCSMLSLDTRQLGRPVAEIQSHQMSSHSCIIDKTSIDRTPIESFKIDGSIGHCWGMVYFALCGGETCTSRTYYYHDWQQSIIKVYSGHSITPTQNNKILFYFGWCWSWNTMLVA